MKHRRGEIHQLGVLDADTTGNRRNRLHGLTTRSMTKKLDIRLAASAYRSSLAL
jgi:hypothetical protein